MSEIKRCSDTASSENPSSCESFYSRLAAKWTFELYWAGKRPQFLSLFKAKRYSTGISKTSSEVNLLTIWKNDMLVQSRCLSDTFTINYSMTSSGVLWINSLAHDISGCSVTSFQINECVDGAGRERNPSGNKSSGLPLVHMSFGEGRKHIIE